MTAVIKLKDACPWKKSYDKPRQHIKKQRHHFAKKGPSSQSYGFSSGHVWMWELDHKEGWAPKNWCFWTAVLEKTLMNPLDCTRPNQSILKEIHPEYSLEGINSMDMGLTKFWETVNVREAWHAAIHGVTKSWTQLSHWTTTDNFRRYNMGLSIIFYCHFSLLFFRLSSLSVFDIIHVF